MHVTLLAVPGCPPLPFLEERLALLLEGRPEVTASRQLIAADDAAARSGRMARQPSWSTGRPVRRAEAAGEYLLPPLPGQRRTD
jgi:hypothetical protein